LTRYETAKAYAKNRRKIKKAITQINRSLNQAIKENKKELEDANIRMIIILYSAYLEASLGYIVHFYAAQITVSNKDKVLGQRSEIDKWNYLIDLLFRKNCLDGKRKAFNLLNLGHTNFHRYQYINSLTNTEIKTTIELRNKLAHGQWALAFTSEGDGTNQAMTTKLWTLTKKDVLATKNIVTNFIDLVEKLTSSDTQFSTTFDKVVHKLESVKIEHENRYGWLISEIKRKKRPENV